MDVNMGCPKKFSVQVLIRSIVGVFYERDTVLHECKRSLVGRFRETGTHTRLLPPAPFKSTHHAQDGMGAALLDNAAGAAGLIRALRAALPLCVPVTCKIRLLDTAERTLAFAKAMEAAGCAAIGVHMRWVSPAQDG